MSNLLSWCKRCGIVPRRDCEPDPNRDAWRHDRCGTTTTGLELLSMGPTRTR